MEYKINLVEYHGTNITSYVYKNCRFLRNNTWERGESWKCQSQRTPAEPCFLKIRLDSDEDSVRIWRRTSCSLQFALFFIVLHPEEVMRVQEGRRTISRHMIERGVYDSSRVTYDSVLQLQFRIMLIPFLVATYDYIMRDTHNFVHSGTSRRGSARCYSTRTTSTGFYIYMIHLTRTHLAVEKS